MMATTKLDDLVAGASIGRPRGSIFWDVVKFDGESVTMRNGLGNRGSGRTTVVPASEIVGKWTTYTR